MFLLSRISFSLCFGLVNVGYAYPVDNDNPLHLHSYRIRQKPLKEVPR